MYRDREGGDREGLDAFTSYVDPLPFGIVQETRPQVPGAA